MITKVLHKLKFSKNINNKKHAPELIFFNKKIETDAASNSKAVSMLSISCTRARASQARRKV